MSDERKLAEEWPTIQEIARELESYKEGLSKPDEEWCEVRLQVREGLYGITWKLWEGDSSYDWDHRGYWGCGAVGMNTDCEKLAKGLLDECLEQFTMSES